MPKTHVDLKKEEYVDYSASEACRWGRGLYYVYYKTRLNELWDRDQRSGYPHNGGEHTLSVTASIEDHLAWMDIVEETLKIEFLDFRLIREALLDPDRTRPVKLRLLRPNNKAEYPLAGTFI